MFTVKSDLFLLNYLTILLYEFKFYRTYVIEFYIAVQYF